MTGESFYNSNNTTTNERNRSFKKLFEKQKCTVNIFNAQFE